MKLRELDDRLLPHIARLLRRPAPEPRKPPEPRQPRPAGTPEPPAPERTRRVPTGPAPFIVRLRAVDDRYGARGPLALLREIPQLGALLLAVVVLVGGATIGQRLTDDRRTVEEPDDLSGTPGDPDPTTGTVGPALGDKVAEYVRDTNLAVVRAAVREPDDEAYAVVSFDTYLSVTAAAALVAVEGVAVTDAYYRVPPPPPQAEIRAVPVTDLATDVAAAMRVEAARLTAEAAELEAVSKTIDNDPEQRAFNEATAKALRAEAAKLGAECACLIGVVVRAPLRLLAELAVLPGVRVVHAAAPGAEHDDLTFRPLLPEEKVTVTGGNEG